MQYKTLTTVGSLRIGDIFHLPRKSVKFQVMDTGITWASVNNPDGCGGTLNKYDQPMMNTKQVIFLRHTRPLQGESCLFGDLQPGDIFHAPDNVINEYVINDAKWAYGTNGEGLLDLKPSDKVIFVKSSK